MLKNDALKRVAAFDVPVLIERGSDLQTLPRTIRNLGAVLDNLHRGSQSLWIPTLI